MVDIVFIVPYRNREEHLKMFVPHMKEMCKSLNLKPFFVIAHQCDTNSFNRGAMKNIGFLEALKIYPDAIFVINDIDIVPKYAGAIKWIPKDNCIRHCTGHKNKVPPYHMEEKNNNLGGTLSFKNKELFKMANGFPNFPTWGPEDWMLRRRCRKLNIDIDEDDIVNHDDPNFCIMYEHKPTPGGSNNHLYENYEKENKGEIIIDGIDNLKYTTDNLMIDDNVMMCNIKFEIINNIYIYSLVNDN